MAIAPPLLDEFELNVVLDTVKTPGFEMAPPSFVVTFELNTALATVRVPRLSIAAPPLLFLPLASVIPLIEAISPSETKNIWTALLPLTVSRFAPGPVIIKESPVAGLMVIADARVMVFGVLNDESKTIVSEPAAAFESKTACRKLPAPLLAVLVTVNVAALALIAAQMRTNRLADITVPNDFVVVIFTFLRCGVAPPSQSAVSCQKPPKT